MLTKTEEQVYALALEGLSYQEIAERMYVAVSTIQTHMKHIFKKMKVNSHPELIVKELELVRQELTETKNALHIASEFCVRATEKNERLLKKIKVTNELAEYIQSAIDRRPHSDNTILENIKERIAG